MAQRADRDSPDSSSKAAKARLPGTPEGDPSAREQDAASGAAGRTRTRALIETIRTAPSQAQRQAAWTELLAAHEDRIFATCLRMVRDYEAARDLTQDSMVKVIQGLDSFDTGPGSARG